MRRVAGALLVAAAGVLTSCSSSSNDDQTLAVQECKDAVQAQLAYPGDADFPFLDPHPTSDGNGGWRVSGTVAAKNGFGGSHTLQWTCSVDRDGNVSAHVAT